MINTEYVTPEAVRDGDRAVRRRRPILHRWRRSLAVLRRLAAARRVLVRRDRRRPHVLFGGYGRYFDRILYDWTLAERARLQYATRTFQFSRERRHPRRNVTIPWDPSYLSREGLDALIDRGIAPNPEVFLMDNEGEPPVSNQWSAGVRTAFGGIVDVRDLQRHPDEATAHLHPRQPAPRRHVLPARARLSPTPDLEGPEEGLVRCAVSQAERPYAGGHVGHSASPTRWARRRRPAAISSASTTRPWPTIRATRRDRRAPPRGHHRHRRAAVGLHRSAASSRSAPGAPTRSPTSRSGTA